MQVYIISTCTSFGEKFKKEIHESQKNVYFIILYQTYVLMSSTGKEKKRPFYKERHR